MQGAGESGAGEGLQGQSCYTNGGAEGLSGEGAVQAIKLKNILVNKDVK